MFTTPVVTFKAETSECYMFTTPVVTFKAVEMISCMYESALLQRYKLISTLLKVRLTALHALQALQYI